MIFTFGNGLYYRSLMKKIPSKHKTFTMQIIQQIQNRIYEIRGERVMLDFDLADLYEVETRVLNQSIKRNIKRFPNDFMFQLTKDEFEAIKFQIEILKQNMSSQFVTTYPDKRPKVALPHAFTEQGVAMLSGILNSDKAIKMNIAIMRAFVEVRRVLLKQNDLREQLKMIKEKLGEHDVQLNQIYDAMENLLDEKAAQRKWNERERIGV
jgi:hypothetical protein